MGDRLKEIKDRLDAVPSGPWSWMGHRKSSMYLGNWQSGLGKCTVMDFVRKGMHDAQPRFPIDMLMHKADELAVQEVEYRDDIVDIDHPVAKFLASSAEDVDWLIRRVEELEHHLSPRPAANPPITGKYATG